MLVNINDFVFQQQDLGGYASGSDSSILSFLPVYLKKLVHFVKITIWKWG